MRKAQDLRYHDPFENLKADVRSALKPIDPTKAPGIATITKADGSITTIDPLNHKPRFKRRKRMF